VLAGSERVALEALAAHPLNASQSNYNHVERGLLHWTNVDQFTRRGWVVQLVDGRLALTRDGERVCFDNDIEVDHPHVRLRASYRRMAAAREVVDKALGLDLPPSRSSWSRRARVEGGS
jgi:hypothetical protein